MAEKVVYNDPTPNNFPDDYDDSQVDSRVKIRSKSIAHKDFGVHVREALMQGIEIGSVVAGEAKNIANDTASRQDEVDQSQKDFEDRYNDQIAGNTDLDEVIDARRPAGGEAYQTLGKRLDTLQVAADLGQFDIDQTIELGGSAPKVYFEKALQEQIAKVPAAAFNIQLITDTHYDERPNRQYANGGLTMNHITNALEFDGKADAIIVNGDNQDAVYCSLDRIRQETENLVSKLYDRDRQSDIYIVLGNHDDGSGRPPYKNWSQDSYIHDAEYRKLYRTNELLNSETRDNGSLYCYKDYPDKKIRLIILNTSDIDETVEDTNGNLKYPRWRTHTIRQQQLNWLANTALKNVPADYHTLVVAHCPLVYGWSDDHATMPNFDIVKNVLKAFKEGTAYTATSSVTDFQLAVTCDFTTQGPREFVGWFAGHTHKEDIKNWDGINIVHCMHSVDDVTNNDAGIVNEDAQTTISIDTTTKTVNLLGFGRATDRTLTY